LSQAPICITFRELWEHFRKSALIKQLRYKAVAQETRSSPYPQRRGQGIVLPRPAAQGLHQRMAETAIMA
jgi:hypothetical protein